MRVPSLLAICFFVFDDFLQQAECEIAQRTSTARGSDAFPATITSRRILNTSSTAIATSGCVVYVASVVTYIWQPAIPNAALPSWATASGANISTDSAGTQITTVTVTTGAYEKSGTWSPLTSISTLTFPTSFTNIPNVYEWAKTSGSISRSLHTEMMPTATLYTDINATATPAPPDDPKGFGWHLASIPNTADPTQVSWLRSVYPNVSWLRDCQATAMFDRNGLPPIAQQALSLIQRPDAASTTSRTSIEMEPITTLARSTVSGASITGTSMVTETTSATAHTAGESSKPSSSQSEEQPVTVMTTSNSAPSSRSAKIMSLIPSNHETQNTVEYSVTSSTGKSSNLPATTSETQQRPGIPAQQSYGSTESPSVSTGGHTTGSYLVYAGHTLTLGETTTIGSGTSLTRIALQTDTAGATVVVGGNITVVSMSQSVQPSITSLPALPTGHINAVPSTKASTSSTLGTSSNEAISRVKVLDIWSKVFAVPLVALVMSLFA